MQKDTSGKFYHEYNIFGQYFLHRPTCYTEDSFHTFCCITDTAAIRSRAKQLRLNSASADDLTDADTYENYDFSDAASVTGNKGGRFTGEGC